MSEEKPGFNSESVTRPINPQIQYLKAESQIPVPYSIFRITEKGKTGYYVLNQGLEFIDFSRLLKKYFYREQGNLGLVEILSNADKITNKGFYKLAAMRMENNGFIAGAFDVDFDKQIIYALHIMDGWKCYKMKDVFSAVIFADRDDKLDSEERLDSFLLKLTDREITSIRPSFLSGSERLREDQISFSDDIIESDGELNFYMDVAFNPDKIFGTNVSTDENDDYINVYANYDLNIDEVCDDLYIIKYSSEGDTEYSYRLNPEEKILFKQKMNAYCEKELGQNLEACRQEYLNEFQTEESQPQLNM